MAIFTQSQLNYLPADIRRRKRPSLSAQGGTVIPQIGKDIMDELKAIGRHFPFRGEAAGEQEAVPAPDFFGFEELTPSQTIMIGRGDRASPPLLSDGAALTDDPSLALPPINAQSGATPYLPLSTGAPDVLPMPRPEGIPALPPVDEGVNPGGGLPNVLPEMRPQIALPPVAEVSAPERQDPIAKSQELFSRISESVGGFAKGVLNNPIWSNPEALAQMSLGFAQAAQGGSTPLLGLAQGISQGVLSHEASLKPEPGNYQSSPIYDADGEVFGYSVFDGNTGEIRHIGLDGQPLDIGGDSGTVLFDEPPEPPEPVATGFAGLTETEQRAINKQQETRFDKVANANHVLNAARKMHQALGGGIHAGALADFKVTLDKWARIFAKGDAEAYSKLINSEEYKAVAGNLVGDIIKQFGSGTGLSDADREYAQQIVGANLKNEPETLRRLTENYIENKTIEVNDYNAWINAVGYGNPAALRYELRTGLGYQDGEFNDRDEDAPLSWRLIE